MDHCRGLTNWFECLRCPHLCTKQCPIESQDVMKEMEKKMRILSVSGADGERKYSGKRE